MDTLSLYFQRQIAKRRHRARCGTRSTLGRLGFGELPIWELGRMGGKEGSGVWGNWHAEKAKAQSFPTELLQVKQVTTLV